MAEKNPGATVSDYLRWRGDLTFAQDPFNEVDNLVLCILSYLNYRRFPALTGKTLEGAAILREIGAQVGEADDQMGLSEKSYLPVMHLAASSVRFGDVRLLGYEYEQDDDRETQFQAISFLLPDGTLYAAYMGTDRSMAGWKEDFNMSFLEAVPAQERALAYAMAMASACPSCALRLGGHSKGGNLAAWAAIHLPEEIQKQRLLAVYNNDGPGFRKGLLETEAYRRVASKLRTYIPESSIVGVLLSHAEDYVVVDSVNRSVLQHEPLSWCCMGPRFVHLRRRSQMGRLSDDVLHEWIGSLSEQEREAFSEALFDLLSKGGAVRTLDELRAEGFAGLRDLMKEFFRADEEKRKIIGDVFRRLAADIGAELKKAASQELLNARENIREAGTSLREARR